MSCPHDTRPCVTGYTERSVHHERNELLTDLCDELAAGDVPAPLAQPFTLAAVWADLARLAGEPVPPDVAAYLDEPAVEAVLAAD